MTEKDMIQVRSNVTKNIINIQTDLLRRNPNFVDYVADRELLRNLDEIIFQLEDLFEKDPALVAKIVGGEIKSEDFQVRVGVGVPLYLHLEVITGIIEKALANNTKQDSTKQNLMGRLQALRNLAINLPRDLSFDPEKHISDFTMDAIVRSRGEFYYDHKVVNGKRYLVVETTHRHETADVRYGDVYDSTLTITHPEEYVFEEDRKEIHEAEHVAKMSVITEAKRTVAKYFINGKLPENIKDFKACLLDENMDPTLLPFVFGLTDELLKYQIDIKEVKTLLEYVKSSEKRLEVKPQEEVIEIEVEPTPKKGMFERFKGKIGKKPAKETTPEDLDDFEKARRKQIEDDEEVRDVVIFQRKIIDGKEVLVPMDTEEYKVVRR